MNSENAYLERMRSTNREQLDYVRERLNRLFDQLAPDFTGQFEIRIPLLRGTAGEVSVVTTERQPKRN